MTDSGVKKETKTISFINMKGGVGKSTLCINVAKELSNKYRVLVIDMDPQFNATQSLIIHKSQLNPDEFEEFFNEGEEVLEESDISTEEDKSAINEIKEEIKSNKFYKKLSDSCQTVLQMFENPNLNRPNPNPSLRIEIANNLSLIPGDLQLSKKVSGDTSEYISVINDHLIEHNLIGYYDFILIDCPPTWSILTLSSLYASDGYIIPSKVDLYSSIGIQLLEDQINEKIRAKTIFNNNGRDLKRLGIVFTLVHKIKAEEQRMKTIKNEFKEIEFFQTKIPHIPSVPSRFILYSDAKNHALYSELTNSLQRLTKEIEEKISGGMHGGK